MSAGTHLIAGAVRGSNTIEGYTVDVADAEAVAAGEEMPTAHDAQTRAAVTGYADALTYVLQAARFEVFAFHPMLLSALHFMMLRGDLDRSPGRYRLGPIWVSGAPDNPPVYTGPEAEHVPELMDELCGWLQDGDLDKPAVVRAAMAHLNLVSIHPWRDGNGRMARCLHTLVLARQLILAPEFSSIEEWLGSSPHNTAMYYAALGEAQGGSFQPERDAHNWLRFCLRAHHLQAQLVQRRLDVAADVWRALADQVAAAGLGERTVAAVYAATRPGGARRATYMRDEGLTRDQAIRDLQGLRAAGLIEETGHGRTQQSLGIAQQEFGHASPWSIRLMTRYISCRARVTAPAGCALAMTGVARQPGYAPSCQAALSDATATVLPRNEAWGRLGDLWGSTTGCGTIWRACRPG